MTSLLKPLAAAALLAVAGSAASAATYDWTYSGSFAYYADGANYTSMVTGQITAQLEGTANASGVTVTDMTSLIFNDGSTNYDLSGVSDLGFGTFLAFSGPASSVLYMLDAMGSEGIVVDTGDMLVFNTPVGSPVTPNWVNNGVGAWSLTEHTVAPPPTTAVPEPTTALLAMLGVPLVAWRARRRAQAEAA